MSTKAIRSLSHNLQRHILHYIQHPTPRARKSCVLDIRQLLWHVRPAGSEPHHARMEGGPLRVSPHLAGLAHALVGLSLGGGGARAIRVVLVAIWASL